MLTFLRAKFRWNGTTHEVPFICILMNIGCNNAATIVFIGYILVNEMNEFWLNFQFLFQIAY